MAIAASAAQQGDGSGDGAKAHALASVRGQLLDSTPGSFTDLKGGYNFLCEILGTPATLLLFPAVAALGTISWALTLQWIPHYSTERAWKEVPA